MGKGRPSSRHVEVERKFAVTADAVLPSFAGLWAVAGVEQQPVQSLEAVYFDTAGEDLAANRITLRRRTGGPDEGWHLKLPSAPGGNAEARTEVRAPLGPDLPDDLRDLVLAIVRDRPLRPVARLEVTRTVTLLRGVGGTALAEFCDDRVSAGRIPAEGEDARPDEQNWREWELELVDPDLPDAAAVLDRLANRLLDAGAAPAGHASKLAKVLGDRAPKLPAPPTEPVHRAVAEQVAKLLEWDRAVRIDADDAVHQMRVATRQIRSLLGSDTFDLPADDWILSELRELAAVLGTARDAEVLAERYREALAELPNDLVRGPVYDRLVEGARRHYEAGLRRSLRAMRSQRYFRLLDGLDALVAKPPVSGNGDRPPTTVAPLFRKVRAASKAADRAEDDDQRDEALHRIRKAAKRLRYVAAATGDSAVERNAKVIQTLLGEHQDSVVSRAHLLQQAAAAHAAFEDTFTYGVLFQCETDLGERCREDLDDALAALRRSVQSR